MANFFSNTTGLQYILDALESKALPTIHTSTCEAFPSAVDQTIRPVEGFYFSEVRVPGDANLIADNIKSGVTIFGVEGALTGSGNSFETIPDFTYSVNDISGAEYGFKLDSDGFYKSQNKGIDSSYAICRVNFTVTKQCNIVIEGYNLSDGEDKWDYGFISKLDTALGLNNSVDDASKLKLSFYGAGDMQYIALYENVTVGTHYIDIKYRKDSSYGMGEDILKFRIIESSSLDQEILNGLIEADEDFKAENIRKGVNILGINGTYGAATEDLDAIFNRTISGTYTNTDLEIIPSGAFCACNNLVSATFARASQVNDLGFYQCENLKYVSFPLCSRIGYAAFSNCYNLVSAYFNNCSTIGEDAFAWCNLKTLSFPAAREIGYYAFAGNPMSSVSMYQVYSIASYAFAYCSSLAKASFAWCRNIGSSAFVRCSRLSQLYLKSSSVCALANSNAFTSTPFAGYSNYFSGTPYIYVPTSLVASYKAAANWSYFSKYISGV